ncbi:MAG TPA: Holliday junction resolvase RuvX [Acidimicrobiales bacterium]|nr:Holliday junction resolvase RuvX [Acidimicrobiales bacterium]
MRALGVDLGARRIGLALSDPGGILASPAGVIERGSDHGVDHDALARRVAETGTEVVVVGLPLSLSGAEGPAARAVRAEVEEIRARVGVPVEVRDERFSTVVATRSLRQAAGGKAVKARRRRTGVVDSAAAAVFLQSWLDSRGA